jgi:hypothetical protein
MIDSKLQEYSNLLDFKNEYFIKDFNNNLKFVKWAVIKMRKKKIEENEIIEFLEMTIRIHKEIYIKDDNNA